jgi:hypothetical protein
MHRGSAVVVRNVDIGTEFVKGPDARLVTFQGSGKDRCTDVVVHHIDIGTECVEGPDARFVTQPGSNKHMCIAVEVFLRIVDCSDIGTGLIWVGCSAWGAFSTEKWRRHFV